MTCSAQTQTVMVTPQTSPIPSLSLSLSLYLSLSLSPPRMKQVQEEQFVNFAVKLFLEMQESELRRFEALVVCTQNKVFVLIISGWFTLRV